MSLVVSRAWGMPNRDTFSCPPIGALVRRFLKGSVISVDIFARNNRWATHTNDLNPKTAAEHHLPASAFLALLEERKIVADVVLLDPPFSPRQAKECYEAAGLPVTSKVTQNGRLYRECRQGIAKITRPGSYVLSFGWNSTGMGSGWQTEEILLVNHGAAHNDTICCVHRRTA